MTSTSTQNDTKTTTETQTETSTVTTGAVNGTATVTATTTATQDVPVTVTSTHTEIQNQTETSTVQVPTTTTATQQVTQTTTVGTTETVGAPPTTVTDTVTSVSTSQGIASPMLVVDVKDNAGTPIPNATVTVTGTGGFVDRLNTNGTGIAVFSDLPAGGTYTVSSNISGTTVSTPVTVSTSRIALLEPDEATVFTTPNASSSGLPLATLAEYLLVFVGGVAGLWLGMPRLLKRVGGKRSQTTVRPQLGPSKSPINHTVSPGLALGGAVKREAGGQKNQPSGKGVSQGLQLRAGSAANNGVPAGLNEPIVGKGVGSDVKGPAQVGRREEGPGKEGKETGDVAGKGPLELAGVKGSGSEHVAKPQGSGNVNRERQREHKQRSRGNDQRNRSVKYGVQHVARHR